MTEFASWLNGIAAIVGPVSIIVGAPGAIIGSIVAVVKVRKWAVHTLAPQQEATQAAAHRATSAATEATEAAKTAAWQAGEAVTQSKASRDTNVEVAESLVLMATELGKTLTALEQSQAARDREAARNDEVFAALLRAKSGPEIQTMTEAIRVQHARRQELWE